MKKSMKKLAAIVMTATMLTLLAASPAIASAASPVNLRIDGVVSSPDVAAFTENGRTLVPMRMIAETLGAEVAWSDSNRQATFTTAMYTVVFTIGSDRFTVNGETKSLDVPAQVVNGRTMVPMRAFAEAIGADVNYDATSNTATVDYFTRMTGSLKLSGSTTVQPIAQGAADYLITQNPGLSITVAGGGSGAGRNDALAGTVNIGMISSALSAQHIADGLLAHTIANDGIALIVHPSNPVSNLTAEQAMQIFAGEIRNWNEVGGNNAPIILHTRETGSGTLDALSSLLMAGNAVAERATPHASSTLIKQAVAREANAIGFDSIGFVDSTVKKVTLDNREANTANVLDKTYLLGRELYVCTKGEVTDPLTAKFIDFLRSVFCQQNIVESEGYIQLG